jgi:MFS transporter, OPA family, glycerol-3-phosphate transporter
MPSNKMRSLPAADRLPLLSLVGLFLGYASSYFHRADLAVLGPLWRAESGRAAMAAALPDIASVGLLVYALGKFAGGMLAERLGARRLFVAALVCAGVAELGAAATTAPLPFALWRMFGMGALAFAWPSLGQIVANVTPRHRLAIVMAFLSQSYLLGDAAVRAILASVVRSGGDTAAVLRTSAIGLAVGAAVATVALAFDNRAPLVERPRPLAAAPSVPTAMPSVLRSMLWLAGMNFTLAIVRESLGFWSPLVLTEAGGFDLDGAVRASALLPLASCGGALLAGLGLDRGPAWRVLVLPAAVGALPLWLLATTSTSGSAVLWCLAVASFCTAFPSSLASGALPLRSTPNGSARWLGLVDGAGTLGAVLAGSGIGRVRAAFAMSTAFMLLAALALLAASCALLYLRTLRQRSVAS